MKKVNDDIAMRFVLAFVLILAGCAGTPGRDVPTDELRAKATQGDMEAQFQLGLAYDQGRGIARNQSEAAAWYRRSAEQGYAVAQNNLGSLYQYGEGVSQDNVEAVRWYQKAADQGFGEAYTSLGYMYDVGLGVKQDKLKAATLYQSGAEKGSVSAMLNLGLSYWKGDGVERDFVQAHKWLDLARFYTQNSQNMQLKYRVRGALDQVEKEMTSEQISTAEKLTKEWNAAHRSK